MSRLCLLVVLFLTTGYETVQNVRNEDLPPDDPGKYSYPIFVIQGKRQFAATAFFYLLNDTTYLISCYHSTRGMSPMHSGKKKISFTSDSLYIKYQSNYSNTDTIAAIDVSEKKIGQRELFDMSNGIDLVKIPIEKPNGFIHYINDLIDTAYFNKKPDSVIAYGFPYPYSDEPFFVSILNRYSGNYEVNGFEKFDSAVHYHFTNFATSETEKLHALSRYYYFIMPVAEKGYSGSPLLGKFKDQSNKIVYKFMGVIFGREAYSGQSWVIRPDICYQYLNGQLKNPFH